MSVPLSRKTLGSIPDKVAKPPYQQDVLRAGIVHFGVGNFHRSHQGSYLDQLFAMGRGYDWGVVGAGVMPADERVRDVLIAQDYMTLLVTQSADRSEARIIAPMVDFLPVGDQEMIVTRLADPAIRIVSLTVTEGGYFLDAEGRFDPSDRAIRADVGEPDRPRTVFGLLLAALKCRLRKGLAPFTVMSCDNLPHNGELTRRTVVGLARLTDPKFADWIDAHVAFPNSMVDRITPATSDRERQIAREVYGVADEWPVFAEEFVQWVLEDNFPQGRPALESVGVTFVEDVTPHEHMKLRILNASHAIIAYPAALLGITYAHDAVIAPLIAPMLARVQIEEIIPGVDPVPEMTPARYFESVRERFANPKIADTVDRLCYDGSNRQPKFIVPAVREALERGLPIEGLALASALWCRYCAGVREDGSSIAPNDPQWDKLNRLALNAREDAMVWLDQVSIYGSVGQAPRFREAFSAALCRLWSQGLSATLTAYARGAASNG